MGEGSSLALKGAFIPLPPAIGFSSQRCCLREGRRNKEIDSSLKRKEEERESQKGKSNQLGRLIN